jgi:hypothetical protein
LEELELPEPEFELPEFELPELELPEFELPVLRLAFPLPLLEDEPLEVLELLELPEWLEELVLWVEPGRAAATAPTATTLANPTAAVVTFSRYRPRSRWAMAWAIPRDIPLLMSPSLSHGDLRSR